MALGLIVTVVAVAVVVAGWQVLTTHARSGKSAAASGIQSMVAAVNPLPAPPTIVQVATADVIDLEAGRYRTYTFTLNETRPCTLTGRIVGVSGGNRDFDLLVVDQDGLLNWKNHASGKAYLRNSRTAAVTLDVPLPSSGQFHLVLSNTFSRVTDKAVRIDNVVVTCEGPPGLD